MNYHQAAIPEDFRVGGDSMSFDRANMKRLYDEGFSAARGGRVWRETPPDSEPHEQTPARSGNKFIAPTIQTSFFTNFHRRSIRFRFGEYDGRNNNSIPNFLAASVTNAHRWYSARGNAAEVCAGKLLRNAQVETTLNATRTVAATQTEMNATWLFAKVKREAEHEGEGSSHGARVSALTLAAKLLGLLKDQVDIAVSGKTAEQLKIFRARYASNNADDAPVDA